MRLFSHYAGCGEDMTFPIKNFDSVILIGRGINDSADAREEDLVAHTGLEPVISALRGQRVNQLHQCALMDLDYRCAPSMLASGGRLRHGPDL